MNPTASSLERAHNCPASEALPRSNHTSKVAVRGTDIHAFVSRRLMGVPLVDAIAKVSAEHRATCLGIDLNRIVGDLSEVRSEVSFALNTKTDEVRDLGSGLNRNYPDLGTDWLVGTADVVGVRIDGVPACPDIKTGYGDVTAPAENYQLGFFGRVLSILHDADEADVRLAHVRADGAVFTQAAAYDRLALDDWGDAFVEIVEGVAKAKLEVAAGRVDVSEGSWCRYCPSLNSCPAKTAMARQMLPTLQGLDAKLSAMTLEERGRAYEIAHQIKPTLERVLDYIKASAVQAPIPLSSGKVLAPTYQQRENFVQERALALMRELGAKQEQIDECYRAIEVEQVKAVWPGTAKKNRKKKESA